MEREDEWIDMIGQALQKAIQWVESVTGKRRRNLKHVVLFV